MSRGDLQEMEVGTNQSKGPVNANAKPGDPMPKLTTGGTPASYEDLGGPSPDLRPCGFGSAGFAPLLTTSFTVLILGSFIFAESLSGL